MAEFTEVMKQVNRICETYRDCIECPLTEISGVLTCEKIIRRHSQEAEEVIMKWAKEHPIETNADKFKEVFGVGINKRHITCTLLDFECEDGNCNACEYYNFWDEEYKEQKNEQ